jgi:RHS repeat-associated protein
VSSPNPYRFARPELTVLILLFCLCAQLFAAEQEVEPESMGWYTSQCVLYDYDAEGEIRIDLNMHVGSSSQLCEIIFSSTFPDDYSGGVEFIPSSPHSGLCHHDDISSGTGYGFSPGITEWFRCPAGARLIESGSTNGAYPTTPCAGYPYVPVWTRLDKGWPGGQAVKCIAGCKCGFYLEGDSCVESDWRFELHGGNIEYVKGTDCGEVYRDSTAPEMCPEFAGTSVNSVHGRPHIVESDARGLPAGVAPGRTYSPVNPADHQGSPWRLGFPAITLVDGEFQSGDSLIKITRSSGAEYFYARNNGGAWFGTGKAPFNVVALLDGGWQISGINGVVETYSATGELTKVVESGMVWVYSAVSLPNGQKSRTVENQFGNKYTLIYNSLGQVVSFVDRGNKAYSYEYDGLGNLRSVIYPSGDPSGVNKPKKLYHYEDPRFPYYLTGVTNELGVREYTFSYDSSGYIKTVDKGGAIERVEIDRMADNTVAVSYANGATTTYQFVTVEGAKRVSQISGNCPSCGTHTAKTEYNSNGTVSRRIDKNGIITTYEYNSRRLETQRLEAVGTAQQREIRTDWHDSWNLPTATHEPGRRTEMAYFDNGQLRTRKTIDTATNQTATTTYSYYANGLLKTVDGPRTDVSDVTTYTYDASGNLATVSNALGHVTSVLAVDAHGRPTQTRDPNNVVTTLTYDPRGRLLSRSIAGATTQFSYLPTGDIHTITLPNGSVLTYSYDDARRLERITDTLGHSLRYARSYPVGGGEQTVETVHDANGQLRRTRTQLDNELGQLAQILGANGQQIQYDYDPNGNRLSESQDGLTTTSAYDALGRITQTTDAAQGQTHYRYDLHGNLDRITDPKGLSTTYTYNGLGCLTKLDSPDTGTTTYLCNLAGNRIQQTDARNIITTYSYDALGRLSAIQYPSDTAQNVSFTYDNPTHLNSVGRLSTIQDPSGVSAFDYDPRGTLRSLNRVQNGKTFVTEYRYDLADQLIQINYPSGRRIMYQRDNTGRITGVTTQASATAAAQTLASNVNHLPFGPLSQLAYGNGLNLLRAYDQDYRLASQSVGGVLALDYTYTARDNLSRINDAVSPSQTQTFAYDALNRLTQASGSYASALSYQYDPVGNRLQENRDGSINTYGYPSSSHRLQAISGAAPQNLSYDAVGNTTQKGNLQLSYNAANRLSQAQNGSLQAQYTYNGQGQRVRKTVGGHTTHYHYDQAGQLIAESDASGATTQEYVYLDGERLATLIPGKTVSATSQGQIYGDSQADGIVEANGADITLPTSSGTYTVQLNHNLSYSVSANVIPQPPVANAGPDQTVTLSNGSVTVSFDGSASQDPDGILNSASYAWDSTEWHGQKGGVNPSHSFTQAGTYLVVLTVTDAQGLSHQDTMQITVKAPTATYTSMNLRGTANNWGNSAMSLVAQNTWRITATFGSGTNERFKLDVKGDWTQAFGDNGNDGIAALGEGDIKVTQGTGSYVITFNDSSKAYTVQKQSTGPQPPVANAGPDQTVTLSNGSVTVSFDGSASQDPDGTLSSASYAWTSPAWSGSKTGVNPSHSFTQAGSYTVTLTVTDAQGLSSQDTVLIQVNSTNTNIRRTVIFMYGQTVSGQDMFIRGGLDWGYAKANLGRDCAANADAKWLCAIPITHNGKFASNAQRANDKYLDWYGAETGQGSVEGSPLVWTTNNASNPNKVSVQGYGYDPENTWGDHYWKLDVQMDCSKGVKVGTDYWVELKSYISNGPGWEANVSQAGAPYTSGNHFAKCGYLNMFKRGQSSAEIKPLANAAPASGDAATSAANFSQVYLRAQINGQSQLIAMTANAQGFTAQLTLSGSGNTFHFEVSINPTTGYLHNDHLGTTQAITDQNKSTVWKVGQQTPFGEFKNITGSITFNLRLPGQYHDSETGLHQNWHRDYNPTLGRYIESDPIGLKAGVSTFGYVRQNPLRIIDPLGLISCNSDGTVNIEGVPQRPSEGAAAWAQHQYEINNTAYTKASKSCGGSGKWKCNCFVRDAFIQGGGLTLKDLPKYYRPDGSIDPNNFARANDLADPEKNTNVLKEGEGNMGDIVAWPASVTGHTGVVGCDGKLYSAREFGVSRENRYLREFLYWWDDRPTIYRECCGNGG